MEEKERPMLLLQEGPAIGQSWPIDREVITIGRGEDNDVVLADRGVSRHHARIRREGERCILEDLDSKNGTFLNGQPVHEPLVLQDGDEIQIALRFRLTFVDRGATAPVAWTERRMGLHLDEEQRRVWMRGQELLPPLSLSQYRLLRLLWHHKGRVCSRDEIIAAVWPEEAAEGVSDQAIDALVRRLRRRLATLDPDQTYVVTLRGHGFKLA